MLAAVDGHELSEKEESFASALAHNERGLDHKNSVYCGLFWVIVDWLVIAYGASVRRNSYHVVTLLSVALSLQS